MRAAHCPARPPGEPQGTSAVAIASAACGAGGLVLSVVFFGAVFLLPHSFPSGLYWSVPLGIVACIAAVVLGIVALIQIPKTRRRGKPLAAAGMILGCAVPPLSTVILLVSFAAACKAANGC
jgi:ABC-type spermidine/putrescine transport system permease subunit II